MTKDTKQTNLQECPPVLYKYLGVKGALETLKSCSLKFTSPNEFNDPFELMPQGYKEVSDEVKNQVILQRLMQDPKFYSFYNELTGINYTWEEWKIKLQTSPQLIQQFADKIFNGLNHRDWEDFRDRASKRIVCACLSQKNNNLLMWAHYADMHKGTVIGFKTEYFINWHKVNYTSERVNLPFSFDLSEEDFRNKIVSMMSTKSEDWSYEQEWRSIISARNNKLRKVNNIYLFDFPPEAVDSIIMGNRIEKTLKEEVLANVLKFPNCKISKAQLHKINYALDIVKC